MRHVTLASWFTLLSFALRCLCSVWFYDYIRRTQGRSALDGHYVALQVQLRESIRQINE